MIKFNQFKYAVAFIMTVSVLPILADDDNEIFLQQSGDTLTLTIDQVGYGNKFGGTIANGSVATDMILTGTSITFNLDQIGNSNQLFGPAILDSGTINMTFTGDSNIFDWNIGDTGDSDNSNYAITVTGDSNTWDFDQGGAASANYLDMDLTLVGNSNQFFIDVDSDQAKWEMEITGDSNNVDTKQLDASDHDLKVVHVGDSINMDIIQQSGTCGNKTCPGKIDLQLSSDNATVTINQKDTGD
tara:strand:+ start:1444 stop:2172 length:729 start_codon:yes stop_codon:yes gene_type:complete